MPKIVFVSASGASRIVEARTGLTVMEAAVKAGVEGIVAECGGACACATCHVYVDPSWEGRLAAPSSMEEGMLEFATGRRTCSRLSCQISVDEELDGLIVRTPEKQG